jgi:hypothetical protein
MIVKSLYIGFAENALPPVNLYSINYKWDLTPHGVQCDLIYPYRGHNNNVYKYIYRIILIQVNLSM